METKVYPTIFKENQIVGKICFFLFVPIAFYRILYMKICLLVCTFNWIVLIVGSLFLFDVYWTVAFPVIFCTFKYEIVIFIMPVIKNL